MSQQGPTETGRSRQETTFLTTPPSEVARVPKKPILRRRQGIRESLGDTLGGRGRTPKPKTLGKFSRDEWVNEGTQYSWTDQEFAFRQLNAESAAVQVPTKDADRGPESVGDNGSGVESDSQVRRRRLTEGGSSGGGSSPPPEKKDSGTQEALVPPTEMLRRVEAELQAHNLAVECPTLVDATSLIRDFRETGFAGMDLQRLHDIQHSDLMSPDVMSDGKSYYGFVARHGFYKGGGIPLENVSSMTRRRNPEFTHDSRVPRYFDDRDHIFSRFAPIGRNLFAPALDEDGRFKLGTILEIAPGNGDLSIRLKKTWDVQEWVYENEHRGRPGQKPKIKSIRAMIRAWKDESVDKSKTHRTIKAIDYTPEFVDLLRRKRKIDAVCGDICAPPEELFDIEGIEPGSVDLFIGNLWLDRIEEMIPAIRNVRYMARPDGSSRAFFGVLVPFEPTGDVVTKNRKVQKIPFWNREGDIREQFMDDVDVSEAFQEMDDEFGEGEALRAQIIFNLVMRLNELGIVIENIGEQPYEVYSPHCIIEPASIIRTDPRYEELRDYDFGDPDIQAMNDAIFANSSEYPNDRVVGYPQRYNRLLLLGGRVLPKNGLRFTTPAA